MERNNRGNHEAKFIYKPDNRTPFSPRLEDNVAAIKGTFKDCDDMVYREFRVGGPEGRRMFLFYIDGMADKTLIDNFVTTPLMVTSRIPRPEFDDIRNILSEALRTSALTAGDFKEFSSIEESISFVLSGETSLIMEGYSKVFVIATKSWPARGITDPSSETSIRGSRDALTETLRMNTALIRRRIRDPRLKVKQKQVGVRSKTDIAIMYIDDIADKRIVEDLNKRIEKICIDSVIDSGYLEQLIEEKNFSPFPQIQATERPDVVAAGLYEGRVGIVVDNSPFALVIPATLTAFFQSPEDYYTRSVISSFLRIVRVLAALTALLAPALYIAITSFHPGIIPSKLALSIAATREGVPFPAFVEAIIMEITFELLREAGVRLPRPIGSTIGIVGGVIIGQAAVSANIVSPIMVIVVSVTAIASFAIPNYEVSSALRLIRFALMMAASIYGLYGIVLGGIMLVIHLVTTKSFGIPYLSPLAPFSASDMKDTFIRVPRGMMKKRPEHYQPENLIRQGNGSSE